MACVSRGHVSVVAVAWVVASHDGSYQPAVLIEMLRVDGGNVGVLAGAGLVQGVGALRPGWGVLGWWGVQAAGGQG